MKVKKEKQHTQTSDQYTILCTGTRSPRCPRRRSRRTGRGWRSRGWRSPHSMSPRRRRCICSGTLHRQRRAKKFHHSTTQKRSMKKLVLPFKSRSRLSSLRLVQASSIPFPRGQMLSVPTSHCWHSQNTEDPRQTSPSAFVHHNSCEVTGLCVQSREEVALYLTGHGMASTSCFTSPFTGSSQAFN